MRETIRRYFYSLKEKIVQQTSLGFLNLLGHGWSVKKTEKAIFDLLKQTYRDCIVTELLFKLCRAERYHG